MRALLRVGVASMVMSACGGSSSTPPAPSDGGHPRDAADDVSVVEAGGALGCPKVMPAAGTPCPLATTSCEYGSDPEITCDTVMTCEADGWRESQAPRTSGCSTTNPPACPASYTAVVATRDQSCGPAVACYYAEARCDCEQVCLGACAHPLDASPPPLTWSCDVSTAAECPSPRPRLGSSCTTTMESLACDYGGCAGNVTLQCQEGSWLAIGVACPH